MDNHDVPSPPDPVRDIDGLKRAVIYLTEAVGKLIKATDFLAGRRRAITDTLGEARFCLERAQRILKDMERREEPPDATSGPTES